MKTTTILDVTVIEPRFKHATIFQKFDELQRGESFIIHNDHDPKPLYYQLLAERGNVFIWQYLEEGPQFWKVKIEKRLEGEKELTIGEIVSRDYRKAEIFKKFGLDFCCGGKKTLPEACKEKKLDIDQIERELNAIDDTPKETVKDYNQWELNFLADYIINTHHKYILQAIPVIYEYTQKVAKVHGQSHPEAVEIAATFVKIIDELKHHMAKEENVLFPYIKILVSNKKQKMSLEPSSFGTIQNPIKMMEIEHDEVGQLMQAINKLSNEYTPPVDACTTYRLSYAKLKEFENDLQQHIHLENNILFPKAIELEIELLGH